MSVEGARSLRLVIKGLCEFLMFPRVFSGVQAKPGD